MIRIDAERFRAKWRPVRVKKTRQNKNPKPGSDSIRSGRALARAQSEQRASAGVVLLHGIANVPWSLRKLERALRISGFATLNLSYASRKKPLEKLAEDIHVEIGDFLTRFDGPLHFVGHSMGGLLTRVYLARYRPPRLARVVMLGTPNGGSEIADLLHGLAAYRAFFGPAGLQLTTRQDDLLTSLPPPDYQLGIVAGSRAIDPISSTFILPRPNDGMVSVHSTRLAGMADHIIIPATHPGLIRRRDSIEQTIAFLRDGKFKSDDITISNSPNFKQPGLRSLVTRRLDPRIHQEKTHLRDGLPGQARQ
jgi:pimeloyl-ACP methyl ester carboxylesterase